MRFISDLNDLQNTEKKIIFATTGKVAFPGWQGKIKVYPNETELRTDRLSNPWIIYLDELIKKNCKHCYGTGREGWKLLTEKKTELLEYLEANWGKNNKTIGEDLADFIGLDNKAAEVLQRAYDELPAYNDMTMTAFFDVLLEKFPPRKAVFCRQKGCLVDNAIIKFREIKREEKFAATKQEKEELITA